MKSPRHVKGLIQTLPFPRRMYRFCMAVVVVGGRPRCAKLVMIRG